MASCGQRLKELSVVLHMRVLLCFTPASYGKRCVGWVSGGDVSCVMSTIEFATHIDLRLDGIHGVDAQQLTAWSLS